jgi:uncharacterized membrane protein YebE (DUF533 family)
MAWNDFGVKQLSKLGKDVGEATKALLTATPKVANGAGKAGLTVGKVVAAPVVVAGNAAVAAVAVPGRGVANIAKNYPKSTLAVGIGAGALVANHYTNKAKEHRAERAELEAAPIAVGEQPNTLVSHPELVAQSLTHQMENGRV